MCVCMACVRVTPEPHLGPAARKSGASSGIGPQNGCGYETFALEANRMGGSKADGAKEELPSKEHVRR